MDHKNDASRGPRPWSPSILLALAAGLALAGLRCGGDSSSIEHDNPGPDAGSDAPPESEGDGGVLDGGPILPCPVAGEPKDSSACVDEPKGLFVSQTGNDANDGSKAKPFQSIGKALAKIAGDKSVIYICEGQYDEDVRITKPVSIFGGLSCSTWRYTGKHSSIIGAAPLTVLDANGVLVADIDVKATAAGAIRTSSIAGFIANSTIALRRTAFTAADGVPATDQPAEGPGFPGPAATTPRNEDPAPNPACPAAKGGRGSFSFNVSASPGTTEIRPPRPDNATGAGGVKNSPCGPGTGSDGTGVRGSNNPYGGNGGAGAVRLGLLVADGWFPEGGATGLAGQAGQGGGGGISLCSGGVCAAYGGNGGTGGCGGAPGKAGTGGGSSFAVAAFNSHVSAEFSRFSAGAGGKGGNGGGGGVAQAGGEAGSAGTADVCPGGQGGSGSGGGGGGAGAGGLSVGILWSGTPPTLDGKTVKSVAAYDSITVAANGGNGGQAGPAGNVPVSDGFPGTAGGAGANGVAQAILGLDAVGSPVQ